MKKNNLLLIQGKKNNENKNRSCLSDIDIKNKENKNYSNIFNNSKEIITRSSLNLKNHLDERLSTNSKTINFFILYKIILKSLKN